MKKPAGKTRREFVSYRDASTRLAPRLKDAGINIQLYENRIRISPSVYNSADDIEKLLDVLSKKE